MGIRGVGQNYYHNNTTTDNGTKNVDSFYKKTSTQKEKDRREELLEGYLGKRIQSTKGQYEILSNKMANQKLARNRQETSGDYESRLKKALNAYKASIFYKY